jgi:hypothetical protein
VDGVCRLVAANESQQLHHSAAGKPADSEESHGQRTTVTTSHTPPPATFHPTSTTHVGLVRSFRSRAGTGWKAKITHSHY